MKVLFVGVTGKFKHTIANIVQFKACIQHWLQLLQKRYNTTLLASWYGAGFQPRRWTRISHYSTIVVTDGIIEIVVDEIIETVVDVIFELILFFDYHLETITMETCHSIHGTGWRQAWVVCTNTHISIIVHEVVELWQRKHEHVHSRSIE